MGDDGRVGLGTGEGAEGGPDHSLGLGTLPAHDFMGQASSIYIKDLRQQFHSQFILILRVWPFGNPLLYRRSWTSLPTHCVLFMFFFFEV